VVDDARLDFEFAVGAGPAIAGTTGKTRRIVGYASSAGGVLSGIASTLMGKRSAPQLFRHRGDRRTDPIVI
ncbi:MAG TPA: hypothetical protein VFN67_14540, partial [Polyangiales bacterium]|nr:hypothetical protein [Polyangiales bacterium]